MAPILRHKLRVAVGVGVAAAAGMAWSQQEEIPGLGVFLDFSTGIRVSDNPEGLDNPSGTSVLSVTDLVLGIESVTKQDTLRADLGFSLEYGDQPDDPSFEDGFTNPFASLQYTRFNRSTLVDLGLSVRESDVDFNITDEFLEDFNSNDLIVDSGKKVDRRLDFALELGRDGPLGLNVDAFYLDRIYTDTNNADLNDSVRFRVDLEGRAALSRTVDLTAAVQLRGRDEDDTENTVDRDVNTLVGVAVQVDAATSFTAGVGYGRSESTRTNPQTGVRATDTTQGPTYAFGIVREVTNGVVSFDVSSLVTTTGTQTDLRFGRAFTRPTGGLELTAGVGITDDGSVRPLGSVDWVRELRDGRITARFRQRLSTDTENDVEYDTLNSTLLVGYERDITQLSALSLDFTVAAVNAIQENIGTDRRRASVGIGYSYQLTRDWDINTGYRYSVLEESDQDTVHENEVFATIGRTFSLRP